MTQPGWAMDAQWQRYRDRPQRPRGDVQMSLFGGELADEPTDSHTDMPPVAVGAVVLVPIGGALVPIPT